MPGSKLMIAAAFLVYFAGHAAAAGPPSGNIAGGHRLSEAQCEACHAVDHTEHAGETAPSLTSIANMSSTTSLSLHVFLLTPHPSMPNYRLSAQEVDDVVAYILSLRGR